MIGIISGKLKRFWHQVCFGRNQFAEWRAAGQQTQK